VILGMMVLVLMGKSRDHHYPGNYQKTQKDLERERSGSKDSAGSNAGTVSL